MKKIFVLSLLSLMLLPLAIQADSKDMMNSEMMWGGGLTMVISGLIYFVIFSFVFSLIFWLVHKWIMKK